MPSPGKRESLILRLSLQEIAWERDAFIRRSAVMIREVRKDQGSGMEGPAKPWAKPIGSSQVWTDTETTWLSAADPPTHPSTAILSALQGTSFLSIPCSLDSGQVWLMKVARVSILLLLCLRQYVQQGLHTLCCFGF